MQHIIIISTAFLCGPIPLVVKLDHDDQVAADCVEYPQHQGKVQRVKSTEAHLQFCVQDLEGEHFDLE